MKKILHLCAVELNNKSSFGSGVGGYTNYTNRLIKNEVFFERAGFHNIFQAVSHPTHRKPKIIFDILKLLSDSKNITLNLIKHRPQIIHIHGMYWRSTYREFIFLVLGLVFRAKVFYEARGGSFLECVQSRGFQGVLARILMRKANVFSVQGTRNLEIFKSMGRSDVVYIPNVINPSLEPLRASNPPLSNREIDFSFLGYVSKEKNIGLFFEIARLNPKKSFVCIGAIQKGLLEEFPPPKNVALKGRRSNEESFRILQQSRIFFFPSKMRGEGQPNSILESIWAGCIPIAFDHGYISDLIPDPRLLLKKCLDSRDVSVKLMEIHRISRDEKFDYNDHFFKDTASLGEVKRLAGIYEQLLGRGRSCR